jgi:hypothetical protein
MGWVAAEFFEIEPHKLQLIILALHPTQPAEKVLFAWDSKQHRQTQNWLLTTIERETEQRVIKLNGHLTPQPKEVATAINLDEINEISVLSVHILLPSSYREISTLFPTQSPKN